MNVPYILVIHPLIQCCPVNPDYKYQRYLTWTHRSRYRNMAMAFGHDRYCTSTAIVQPNLRVLATRLSPISLDPNLADGRYQYVKVGIFDRHSNIALHSRIYMYRCSDRRNNENQSRGPARAPLLYLGWSKFFLTFPGTIVRDGSRRSDSLEPECARP